MGTRHSLSLASCFGNTDIYSETGKSAPDEMKKGDSMLPAKPLKVASVMGKRVVDVIGEAERESVHILDVDLIRKAAQPEEAPEGFNLKKKPQVDPKRASKRAKTCEKLAATRHSLRLAKRK